MKDLTVLMTGAGAPGAPGIISCYKNNGERTIKIIGVDVKERVPTIQKLDYFEQVPLANDSKFIDSVLTIAKKYKVDVIQPLVTNELEVFAKNIDLFLENGIKVCVSPIDNLQIANDKGKLIDELKKANIKIPKYYKTTNPLEFKNIARELGYPDQPICFKPTKANGSRGFRIIDNTKDRVELLFNEKPNSTYIKFEEANDILTSMTDIPELLVMEYLPGDEYSVDLLVNRGEVKYCMPRIRLKMNGGISTNCTVVNNEEVIRYCTEIAEHLKLHGNIGIQVRYSIDNKVKILEINPRVQGSIVACAASGVNLPYLGLKLALGEDIPEVNINWNVEMIRYWNEVYFDDSGSSFTF